MNIQNFIDNYYDNNKKFFENIDNIKNKVNE